MDFPIQQQFCTKKVMNYICAIIAISFWSRLLLAQHTLLIKQTYKK